jgi:hypothetical protein
MKLSLDDLLGDDEESGDDNALTTTAPSTSSRVEELLKNLDLSSDDDSASLTSPDAVPSVDLKQRPKIPLELPKKQLDLFSAKATNDQDLKALLDLFDVKEMAQEPQLREEARELLKSLPKETQREVIYKLLGSQPLVEEVQPEEHYPFAIEKLKGKKLEGFTQLLRDVSILGKVSTSEERQLLIEKYNPTEKTVLELEREKYLQQLTRTSYDYCVTEQDYHQIYTTRSRTADHFLPHPPTLPL